MEGEVAHHIVTACKAQVRNADRVSIYVNGSYAFSLTKNQLLEAKLVTGQVLDDGKLAALQRFSDFGKLLERTLRFALLRPHSCYEITQYLQRKKVSAEDQAKLMAFLEERGYINDAAFAKAWVRSRALIKPISQRRLLIELRQKGVDEAAIQAALQAHLPDEGQTLRELIQKKQRTARYRDKQKLTGYLVRQGFDYDDIKTALAESRQANGNPG